VHCGDDSVFLAIVPRIIILLYDLHLSLDIKTVNPQFNIHGFNIIRTMSCVPNFKYSFRYKAHYAKA
jgi:hypothetical protein